MEINKIEEEELDQLFLLSESEEEEEKDISEEIVYEPTKDDIVEPTPTFPLDIILSEHPGYQQWVSPIFPSEQDFWSTYWKTNKLAYFYTYFPIRFLVLRNEFDDKVKDTVGLWTLFARVLITLLHFVALASNDYRVDYLHRVFSPKYTTGSALADCRPVPFGEIFAVFGENRANPQYRHLLYGTTIVRGHPYTRDGRTCLPESILRTHSTVLILALSFLVELGVLHLDVGRYVPHWNQITEYAQTSTEVSYSDRVRLLRSLIDYYDGFSFEDSTFYFSPYKAVWNISWDFLIENLVQTTRDEPLPTGFHSPLDTHLKYQFDVRKDTYECPYFLSYNGIQSSTQPSTI